MQYFTQVTLINEPITWPELQICKIQYTLTHNWQWIHCKDILIVAFRVMGVAKMAWGNPQSLDGSWSPCDIPEGQLQWDKPDLLLHSQVEECKGSHWGQHSWGKRTLGLGLQELGQSMSKAWGTRCCRSRLDRQPHPLGTQLGKIVDTGSHLCQ